MSLVPLRCRTDRARRTSYDIFSRLLNDRIVMLSEDVNSTTASLVMAQLLYLEGQTRKRYQFTSTARAGPSRTAWRFMTPCGISNATFPPSVWVWLASMASVLLARAGAKGNVSRLPNKAEILIQQPLTASGGPQGQTTDITSTRFIRRRTRNKMNGVSPLGTGQRWNASSKTRSAYTGDGRGSVYGLIDDVDLTTIKVCYMATKDNSKDKIHLQLLAGKKPGTKWSDDHWPV